uniref:GNAT family N-acetyltransferase n=1 Tax=candidate division WOR-3 bacterium TaxID=2052148 RepID=A0A7C4Y559_UNCW3
MFKIKFIKGKKGLKEAYKVRSEVFVKEQGIDEDIELDKFDNIATHLILYVDGKPVGTGRFYFDGRDYRLGRIAVLKEYRGRGYGKMITGELIKYAEKKGVKRIVIHSQKYLEKFYEGFGFKSSGKEFIEAGIPHIKMIFKKGGKMATYILLTKLSPEVTKHMKDRASIGKKWMKKVKEKCPEVKFIAHYALLGPYDFLDIYEAENEEVAAKVSMISLSLGASKAESWTAIPYRRFLELVKEI